MTISVTVKKGTVVSEEYQLAKFLSDFVGFDMDDALNYAKTDIEEVREMVSKIKKSILDDKSISDSYKERLDK